MGVWEDQGSAYSCGCDPGMRREHKNIGYRCKHFPDCTYGRAIGLPQLPSMAEFVEATGKPGLIDVGALLERATDDLEQRAYASVVGPERKTYPLATGCLDFFPDALMAVAHVSYVATQQHHPGEPLHWDRNKSTDEPDALLRHLKDRGTLDTDGVRHSAKVAWRSLAMLQKEIEAERDAQ